MALAPSVHIARRMPHPESGQGQGTQGMGEDVSGTHNMQERAPLEMGLQTGNGSQQLVNQGPNMMKRGPPVPQPSGASPQQQQQQPPQQQQGKASCRSFFFLF